MTARIDDQKVVDGRARHARGEQRRSTRSVLPVVDHAMLEDLGPACSTFGFVVPATQASFPGTLAAQHVHDAVRGQHGELGSWPGLPHQIGGEDGIDRHRKGLSLDHRGFDLTTAALRNRQPSIPTLHDHQLVTRSNREIDERFLVETSQGQRAGRCGYRQPLRLADQSPLGSLEDQHLGAFRRGHRHHEVPQTVGAVDFSREQGRHGTTQRNGASGVQSSRAVAGDQIDPIRPARRDRQIQMSVIVEVAHFDEIGAGGNGEDSGRGEKGRVREQAVRSSMPGTRRVGVERVDVAAVDGQQVARAAVAADEIPDAVLVEIARGETQRAETRVQLFPGRQSERLEGRQP